ncbi:ribonuclease HII [Kordiimonas lacus]|uniref:Ribonuclease HII n=1 Tax=Kordiimonas lacus TaxID=637679 RepID=A0A1G7B433_9PROT|nr:ribonuclease HII [Kordiimonas lacus]SDE20995.1 RNase HII [Kordiimonas lacus]
MSDLFDAAGMDMKPRPDWSAEAHMIAAEGGHVCGVDEVGRGPLAGPVVAAAVVLDPDDIPEGLNDSKKLSEKKRQALYGLIQEKALAVSIAEASVAEIDEINILQASMLAMRRAVEGLELKPSSALVDGNRDPGLEMPTRTLIKGDGRSLSIAAASIVAKVFRDDLMKKLDSEFPDYGWAQNAGYGVAKHLAALRLVGATPHHRRSFAPIRQVLSEE